jgi:hypothetical protein
MRCAPLRSSAGLDVQQLVNDGESQPREDGTLHYKGMTCAACAGLHLVDLSTGKLLGEILKPSHRVVIMDG